MVAWQAVLIQCLCLDFEEWCSQSEFTPDPDTDTSNAHVQESPSGVSWIKVSYPFSENLRKHVAAHEEGKWTFPIHLIPSVKPG